MNSDNFIAAAFNGDLGKVQALISDADELELKAALANAAQQGHTDVVELLLENGADINAQTRDGYTPLTMACRGCHWDTARVLIDNGAGVNIETGNGYTALIFASSEGRLEIVEALIAKGANVNIKTVVGSTALVIASNKDIVDVLTKAGAASGSSTPPGGGDTSDSKALTEILFKAMTLLKEGQPVDAADCLLNLETASNDEPLIALKAVASVALANYAVQFSNKYLGGLNEEINRNGWDSGYNLGEAQGRARNLKYKTITWLKMASALDPSNLEISSLIDSYFRINVTSCYDQDLCKR